MALVYVMWQYISILSLSQSVPENPSKQEVVIAGRAVYSREDRDSVDKLQLYPRYVSLLFEMYTLLDKLTLMLVTYIVKVIVPS